MKKEKPDLPKRMLIFFILLASLFGFGTISFKLIDKLSFSQAFVMTVETLAFMMKQEEGLARALQIFLAIFGVMLFWWVLWEVLDIFVEGRFSEYLKIQKFLSKLKKMKNHYIIAGGGRVGEEIAKNLDKNKKAYIIIEKDDKKIDKLKKKGFFVVQGDVTDSDSSDLIDAGIKNAKAIISTLPETEKNLLFTMSAKEINPDIEIYARADNPAFVSKLKKAGAKAVIVPELAAAKEFLESIN